jgi:hypothetical protein
LATTFLSYSRKDIAFAERLDAALKAADQTAWVDWVGIPPTAEFADEINRGIEASDNFLIVLSPDSLDEKSYCRREIAHAAAMHKRIIPVYFRTVAQETVPECVASLNYIFFRETDDFEAAFAKLLAALHTDLLWMSMSSRLLVRALEWDRQGRDNSFVLRDKDLAKAEAWLAEAASKEGKPTELQTQSTRAGRRRLGGRGWCAMCWEDCWRWWRLVGERRFTGVLRRSGRRRWQPRAGWRRRRCCRRIRISRWRCC